MTFLNQTNYAALGVLLVVIVLMVISERIEQQEAKEPITVQQKDDKRPKMHTFFEPLNRGMDTKSAAWKEDHDGEDKLLQEWKAAWSEAGFEPVILTLDDARRHPIFNDVEKEVSKIFGQKYDSMCFYRWFAMAASGGGWMVDYDTFPLNFPTSLAEELPNHGQFTSFAHVVPALMSGSVFEWNRVATLIVNAIQYSNADYKSDMWMLNDLFEQGTHDIIFLPAGKYVRPGFDYVRPGEINCEETSFGIAFHMAHAKVDDAVQKGVFPIDSITEVRDANNHRGEAGQIYLQDWRSQCLHRRVQ